jgi:hypothetical protein
MRNEQVFINKTSMATYWDHTDLTAIHFYQLAKQRGRSLWAHQPHGVSHGPSKQPGLTLKRLIAFYTHSFLPTR